MQTYTSNAAVARCYQLQGGLWQADYTGPMMMTSAIALSRLVAAKMQSAKCTIERTDKALRLFTGVASPYQMGYLIGSPPGCIICADDTWQQTHDFCCVLAKIGVVRVAFRASEIADAMEFSAAMLA